MGQQYTVIKYYYVRWWKKTKLRKSYYIINWLEEKKEERRRLSSNRKKVLKILWLGNWEGKTIRPRCELITVKCSSCRIINTGPHRRGDDNGEKEDKREDAQQQCVNYYHSKSMNTSQKQKQPHIHLYHTFEHHYQCRLFQLWKHCLPS